MTTAQDVYDALRGALSRPRKLSKSDFTLSAGSAVTQREKVASRQFDRPQHLLGDTDLELALLAYEDLTDDAGGTTFPLSHDIVESGATPIDAVVYRNGSRVAGSDVSVDYAANEVTVSTVATGDAVDIYYPAGNQAEVTIEKVSPNGVRQQLWTGDLGLLHLRDQEREPVQFGFSSPWEPIVPEDWYLNVYVTAPYRVAWAQDVDGDGDPEPATNALLSLPRRPATTTVDGLRRIVRHAAAED